MSEQARIDKLVSEHKKLIESVAAKHAEYVPLSVVQAEAYRIAKEAAKSFDESKGVKFSTYLYHSLEKLQRLSTSYGGTVRVSEVSQYKIQKVNEVERALRDELGREPTVDELAHHSGFSLQQVSNLLKKRKKDVNINNILESPIFTNDDHDEWVHFVYHDLPQRDKLIFEHKTGFGGKPALSTEDIAKKLNTSVSTVANRIKIISEMIEKGMK